MASAAGVRGKRERAGRLVRHVVALNGPDSRVELLKHGLAPSPPADLLNQAIKVTADEDNESPILVEFVAVMALEAECLKAGGTGSTTCGRCLAFGSEIVRVAVSSGRVG